MATPGRTDAGASGSHPRSEPGAGPQAGGLTGYEVLVCVCGGIAAHKTAVLVSQLVQQECGVTVAMTRAARRFVGPVTFQALTGRPVFTSLWAAGPHALDLPLRIKAASQGQADIQHLRLSETADLIVVAPATANILGKLAGGIADDLVSTLLLGADCPVLMAPAMNARMWQHPAVQRNVAALREAGVLLVGPESGWQACRAVGPGRMSEPETLLAAVREQLLRRPARAGKNSL